MAGLKPATYARVQDHLSSEGIFLMGDAQVAGFPIRYASQGFEQLYGYKGSEIVGKKCGDLIGGPFILSNPGALACAAAVAELPPPEAEARIRFLNEKAGEACRVMMANPDERVGVALLLNRKKGGALFVCECLVLNLKHPSLNWSYCVGFQRDITKSVSVKDLFDACNPTDYSRLLQSRSSALESRRAVLLGVGSENVVQYLHEKALSIFSLDIWQNLRSEMLASAPGASEQDIDPGTMAEVAAGVHSQQLSTLPPTTVATTTAHQYNHGALYLPLQDFRGQFSAPPVHAPVQPVVAAQSQPQFLQQTATVLTQPQGDAQRQLEVNPAVAFLASAGLKQYAEPLLLNGFDDLEGLLDMSDDDMCSVGLSRGHAAKLRRRLREFKCLQICAASAGWRPVVPAALQDQPQPAVQQLPSPGSPPQSEADGPTKSPQHTGTTKPTGKAVVPLARRAPCAMPTLLQQVG